MIEFIKQLFETPQMYLTVWQRMALAILFIVAIILVAAIVWAIWVMVIVIKDRKRINKKKITRKLLNEENKSKKEFNRTHRIEQAKKDVEGLKQIEDFITEEDATKIKLSICKTYDIPYNILWGEDNTHDDK